MLGNELFDIDTFCPAFDCDVGGVAYSFTDCLGDDTIETLAKHSGVAPGAKIAMFDASFEGFAFIYPEITGNLLWSATDGTGAKIHSNSWGYPTRCQLSELEFVYETFMYEVNGTRTDRSGVDSTKTSRKCVHFAGRSAVFQTTRGFALLMPSVRSVTSSQNEVLLKPPLLPKRKRRPCSDPCGRRNEEGH